MHPLLARTLALIETRTSGMTPADFERHLPGKWSSANILEHLSITYYGTTRGLEKCLSMGSRRATRPTFRQRVGVLLVVELGRFPNGVQAPERTMPKGLAGEAALQAARRTLEEMDRAMTECEARFGSHASIMDHPILGALSLRQWRRFHWIHTRHHMKQLAMLVPG